MTGCGFTLISVILLYSSIISSLDLILSSFCSTICACSGWDKRFSSSKARFGSTFKKSHLLSISIINSLFYHFTWVENLHREWFLSLIWLNSLQAFPRPLYQVQKIFIDIFFTDITLTLKTLAWIKNIFFIHDLIFCKLE